MNKFGLYETPDTLVADADDEDDAGTIYPSDNYKAADHVD